MTILTPLTVLLMTATLTASQQYNGPLTASWRTGTRWAEMRGAMNNCLLQTDDRACLNKVYQGIPCQGIMRCTSHYQVFLEYWDLISMRVNEGNIKRVEYSLTELEKRVAKLEGTET